MAFIAPTAGRVDIAITLAPSSSPSSCRRAVHRHCATPSIAVNSPSRRPSPPIRCALGLSLPHSCCPLLSRSRHAIHCHCRQGAIAQSLAVKEPLCHPLPLPSRSYGTIPCRQGAVAPSIAIKEPLRRTLPSRSRRPCLLTTLATPHAPPRPLIQMVVALPLLMLPPSICRRLSLWHRLLCLLSVRLAVTSPRFSHHHLPSAGASASHRAVPSRHAPIRPLVQLVKASPLLTPPPHICSIMLMQFNVDLMV